MIINSSAPLDQIGCFTLTNWLFNLSISALEIMACLIVIPSIFIYFPRVNLADVKGARKRQLFNLQRESPLHLHSSVPVLQPEIDQIRSIRLTQYRQTSVNLYL